MAQDMQQPGDRDHRAEQARRQKEQIEIQEEDIRWLMANRPGRRIMSRLLDVAGVFRTSFTGNSETFYREGARNVGLQFLADVQRLAPEEFIKMLQEHREPNNGTKRAK